MLGLEATDAIAIAVWTALAVPAMVVFARRGRPSFSIAMIAGLAIAWWMLADTAPKIRKEREQQQREYIARIAR